MDDTTYHAINLIINVVVSGDIESLEFLLDSMIIHMGEQHFVYIMHEVAEYIQVHHPEAAQWLNVELIDVEELPMDFDLDIPTLGQGTYHDLKHIVLDEGFREDKDFKVKGQKLFVTAQVLQCLEDNNYDMEALSEIIGEL